MSGICGIVHLDGAPIDPAPLHAMTESLAFRGPDARHVWTEGCAGLGHTMLRTTFEATAERQPASLDGRVWITADARIDARVELATRVEQAGRAVAREVTDAELILHAYYVWGEDCVRQLLGDFTFALWDSRRQRLLCARDHLGVKPFFYARVGRTLVFSNALDGVRAHPSVSMALNDLAIADFLLFEMSQDPAATAFADVARLPSAHTLSASASGVEARRYWALPFEWGLEPPAVRDPVGHFRELLRAAVSDRLRTRRVAVEMSGGLDSTTIAATARATLKETSTPFEITAHSVVYDSLIPDEERRYSGLAAAALGLPIQYCDASHHRIYQQAEMTSPEPVNVPQAAMGADHFHVMAEGSRVVLTGWDGDTLLSESPRPYCRALWKKRDLARLLQGVLWYAVSQRRLVPATVWPTRTAPERDSVRYPEWIDKDLERRLDLRCRWESLRGAKGASHPLRPRAHRALEFVGGVSCFFESFDAASTRAPLEFRHPFMDLRLIEYCLSLPPLPWCVGKQMLREAMRGVLPEAVLRRPKTPLAGFPHVALLQRAESQWVDRFQAQPLLAKYVDRAKIPPVHRMEDSQQSWMNLRPLSLNFWLGGLRSLAQVNGEAA